MDFESTVHGAFHFAKDNKAFIKYIQRYTSRFSICNEFHGNHVSSNQMFTLTWIDVYCIHALNCLDIYHLAIITKNSQHQSLFEK